MTVCSEKIRGIQWLKMNVYPFCVIAEKSKHQWEFKGIDIPVEGHKSWRQCVQEKKKARLWQWH